MFKSPKIIFSLAVFLSALPAIAAPSKYEAKLIRLYSQSIYEAINNMTDDMITVDVDGKPTEIRLSSPTDASGDYKFYQQLKQSLAKAPPSTKATFRGVYSSGNPEERYQEGKIWFEYRFTSTTKSQKVAQEFAEGAYKPEMRNFLPEDRPPVDPRRVVLITITGIDGRDISKISAKPEEEEVLFPPGIFKITKSSRNAKGNLVVKIDQLQLSKLTSAESVELAMSERDREYQIKNKLSLSDNDVAAITRSWQQEMKSWNRSGFLIKTDLREEDFLAND